MITSELLKLLIYEIKSKKQINDFDEKYIQEKIEKFFLTQGKERKKLEKEFEIKKEKIVKNKLFKQIVKSIRQEIGIVYGSFLTQDFTKKEKILTNINNEDEVNEILRLHKSTRERIDYYNQIYKKIFEWYHPKKIADIACGLNPISYNYIQKQLNYKPQYFASDLNPKDMQFLTSYFQKFKIDAIAKSYDIVNLEILKDKQFQECDLIFLFKALDSFEQIKKNISKQLLEGINAKHIIISFPTKSLISKKEFKIEKRNWLINFINKKNWELEQFEIENELFLLIFKNS